MKILFQKKFFLENLKGFFKRKRKTNTARLAVSGFRIDTRRDWCPDALLSSTAIHSWSVREDFNRFI